MYGYRARGDALRRELHPDAGRFDGPESRHGVGEVGEVQARTEAELDHVAVQTRARLCPNRAERVASQQHVRQPGHDLLGVERHDEKGTFLLVEPVEALERIASLLVRGGEPRYKAQAFRRAATEIKHVPARSSNGSTPSAGCRIFPESARRPRP